MKHRHPKHLPHPREPRPTVNATRRKPTSLEVDPSQTGTLRRRTTRVITGRFDRIKKALLRLIDEEDAFGLKDKDETPPALRGLVPSTNVRWKSLTNAEKIKAFRAWLKDLLEKEVMNGDGLPLDELLQAYVKEAIDKGAVRSFDDTKKKAGEFPDLTKKDKMNFYKGSRKQFLESAFNQPVAKEKVLLLTQKLFNDLEGVVDGTASNLVRIMSEGLVRGSSPRDIARDIAKNVDGYSKARATTIARTEIVRAHAEGQLLALDELGVDELGVMVEWTITKDLKVCAACKALEGIVVKTKEASGMIPRHPNCRCAWIPANVGESTAGQKRGKAVITKAIERSKKLVREDPDEGPSTWKPGQGITKKRPQPVVAPSRNSRPKVPAFIDNLVRMTSK